MHIPEVAQNAEKTAKPLMALMPNINQKKKLLCLVVYLSILCAVPAWDRARFKSTSEQQRRLAINVPTNRTVSNRAFQAVHYNGRNESAIVQKITR